VLGRTIRVNRNELTIVGVAPPEFRGTTCGLAYDMWMPITMAQAMGTGRGTLTFRGTRDLTSTIARLKPGVAIAQARAEARALAARLEAMYPDTNRGVGVHVASLREAHSGAQGILRKPLAILMAVCALLLLIVCANVANLLLARAVARQKELAIRLAMGAQRGRLARQLLTETLVLALAGGIAGVILTMWAGQTLVYLLPPNDMPIDLGGSLNLATLGFTLLVAVLATLFSGLAPALLSVRANLNETLQEGGRSGGFGTHSHRLRGLLVVSEVALATVALIGAGLFFRSFRNASSIEPGFDIANVSVSQFYLSSAGYSGPEQRRFCRTLRERLESAPGVLGVTYSDVIPISAAVPSTPWHQLKVDGYLPAPDEQMIVHRATVPPGYFRFMGIRLLEGREFSEADESGKPLVLIVNETFARRYFRGANPIGRSVDIERRRATVVGLAADSKYHNPMEAPIPFFYVPFQQWFGPGLNFAVFLKTAGDPMRALPALRKEALALNQDAVFTTTRLSEAVTWSLYSQKVAATLTSVVGLFCLLLAAVGLYSVMSYAVTQRTQELGIRMALGARPGDVLRLVVWDGLRLVVPGLLAGVAVALAASRAVSGMLILVSPHDPPTFAAAVGFLGLVALAASYLPALRATRVDPMTALRCG
jgi:predicted permease